MLQQFPRGTCQLPTLKIIAAMIAWGKALFTFQVIDSEEPRDVDNVEFGKWAKRYYPVSFIEDIIEVRMPNARD